VAIPDPDDIDPWVYRPPPKRAPPERRPSTRPDTSTPNNPPISSNPGVQSTSRAAQSAKQAKYDETAAWIQNNQKEGGYGFGEGAASSSLTPQPPEHSNQAEKPPPSRPKGSEEIHSVEGNPTEAHKTLENPPPDAQKPHPTTLKVPNQGLQPGHTEVRSTERGEVKFRREDQPVRRGSHSVESNESYNSTANWLCDPEMLPEKIPNARILLYRYPCHEGGHSLEEYLIKTSEDFLSRLYSKRKSNDNVPIIFVGHAFGCLVLQKALASIKTDDPEQSEEAGSILDLSAGIIFLDAPFPLDQKKSSPLTQNLPKPWFMKWFDNKDNNPLAIWRIFRQKTKRKAMSIAWFYSQIGKQQLKPKVCIDVIPGL